MFTLNKSYVAKKRFDLGKLMAFDPVKGFNPLSSEFWDKIKGMTSAGTYLVGGEENRPDLLSYTLYGDTQYWWILLTYNGLTSPEDLVAGMSINYPQRSELEAVYFTLAS